MTSAPRLATQHYTANGCTLEITATESPLSRWSDRSLLKHIRFKLWLHPPEASPNTFATTESSNLIAQGNQPQLETLAQTLQSYVQTHLGQGEVGPNPLTASHWPLGQKHQLAGSLPLSLSTLELFDVAEALQQYAQSNAHLPALSDAAPRRASSARRRSNWLWGSSVAAAMLLAVGVTATLRNTANVATTTAETTEAGSATAESNADSDLANSDIANGNTADTQIAKATPPSTDTAPTAAAESDEASESGEAQLTSPTNQAFSTPSPSTPSLAQRLPPAATPTPNRSAASAPSPAAQPPSQVPSQAPSPVEPRLDTELAEAAAPPAPNPSTGRTPSAPAPDLRTRVPASRPQLSQAPQPQAEALRSDPPTEGVTTGGVADADSSAESEPLLADSAPSAEAAGPAQSSTFSSGALAPNDLAPTVDAVALYLEGQLLERERLGQAQADALSESSAEAPSEAASTPSVSERREAELRLYEMVLNPNGTVTSLTPLNAAASEQPLAVPAVPIVAPFERDSAVMLRIAVTANNQVTVSPAQAQ
ncbi:MAG: DUF4335 domain-containing protein [Cyanobacteria bacterium J06635_1]